MSSAPSNNRGLVGILSPGRDGASIPRAALLASFQRYCRAEYCRPAVLLEFAMLISTVSDRRKLRRNGVRS